MTPRGILGRCALALVMVALGGHVPARAQDKPLALPDAVRLALEHNLALSIQRLEPLIGREQQREAVGAFDPVLGAGVSYARTERFLNSVLEVNARSGLVQENKFTANYPSFSGQLTTGTQYNLGLTSSILDSNNPLRLFNESYQPVLTLGLTQPLLRDFGVEVNTVKIKQAEKAEAGSLFGVEAKMLGVIREVETKYWKVFYGERHVVVQRGSLALAEDLVQRVTRLRDAGLATDLDVVQAKTAVEVRRADVVGAEAELRAAQAQLRLVVDPRAEPTVPIVVVGQPPDEGPPSDLAGKLGKALALRPEIRQQELLIEKIALDERAAKNNTQWRLDASGSVGFNGLAGHGANPILGGHLPSRLQGQDTYTDAYRDFLTPEGNFNYSVGLQLQIPLGNNEAQGKLAQVRLQRRQEELRLMLLRSQIGVDVETAFQEMTAQAARLTASRQTVGEKRQQLDARGRELDAGRATVRNVLEAQQALAVAQDAELLAWADYAAARASLDAGQAQSFDTYRLSVQP